MSLLVDLSLSGPKMLRKLPAEKRALEALRALFDSMELC